MTALLHVCHSKQSTRLVVRPESWRTVPTCAVSPCPLPGLMSTGWRWGGVGVGG